MTALYEPILVATFQVACGLGGVVCGVLALREHGRAKSDAGDVRPPLSPWLMYCFGFLAGCMLSQVVRYVEQPATVLGAVVVHTSLVALLLFVWTLCNTYARLWNRRTRSLQP